MARNYSPQFLGDPFVTVIPVEEHCSDENTNSNDVALFFNIDATLTTLPSDDDDDDENPAIFSAGRSATFSNSFRLSPGELADGSAARRAVSAALSDVHVADDASAAFVADKILGCCAARMATLRRGAGDGGERNVIKTLRFVAKVDVFVDELPEDDDTSDGDDDDSDEIEVDDDDADEVRVVPASRESIEGLESVRTEKAVTCTVCLEDVRVGSELTRLPCWHCYHMECIVGWLEKNNSCPLCRFEMS